MGSSKTAAPCVVCGQRTTHQGQKRGFAVSYTPKGVPRLVHESCQREWRQRHIEIQSTWPELRPEVLRALSPNLQSRIKRCQAREGVAMPRYPRREHFTFPFQVADFVRSTLSKQKRYKGLIKKMCEVLQHDHPDWMPPKTDPGGYNDFRLLVLEVERQIEQEKSLPKPTEPVADGAASAGIHESPLATRPLIDELTAMAQTAHALINLALARKNSDAIELALFALEDVIKKPLTPAGHTP